MYDSVGMKDCRNLRAVRAAVLGDCACNGSKSSPSSSADATASIDAIRAIPGSCVPADQGRCRALPQQHDSKPYWRNEGHGIGPPLSAVLPAKIISVAARQPKL